MPLTVDAFTIWEKLTPESAGIGYTKSPFAFQPDDKLGRALSDRLESRLNLTGFRKRL